MGERLSGLLAFPVSVVTVLAGIVVFLFAGAGGVDALTLDVRAFEGEPWRAFTTTLVHGGTLGGDTALLGAMHLGFNAFWLFALGAPLEAQWGHVRYAVFVVLTGTISSLCEFAFLQTPVGLSGIVYGTLAARWWLTRAGVRSVPPVPDRVVQFLAFWFFFSIALTLSDTMGIANIAHGVGALMGLALAGLATSSNAGRVAIAAAVTVLAGASAYAAGPGRPLVNLSSYGAIDEMELGLRALSGQNYAEAERRFERATHYRNCPPEGWHNLGVARARQRDFAGAAQAFGRATEMAPGDASFSRAFEQAKAAAGTVPNASNEE